MNGFTRTGLALVSAGCAVGALLGAAYGGLVCLARLLDGCEEPCP